MSLSRAFFSGPLLYALLLLSLGLPACVGDKADTGDVDADGDGVTIGMGDCDDENPRVRPGKEEKCNGIDDNCDGHADEGWPDDDDDGVLDCYEGDLCDGEDNNADGVVDESWPDTDGDGVADCVDAESCDGLDNDGDLLVDEDFDADGDGAPTCGDEGLIDCDDADPDIGPAAEELSGNSIDDDCDGRIDEGDWSVGDLIVTEILYAPDGLEDENAEWFEVLNTTDHALLLNGLTLEPNGGEPHTVTSDTLLELPAGERFVFGIKDAIRGVDVDYAYGDFLFTDAGDGIGLSMDGLALDSVGWGATTGMPDADGASLSLDPDFETFRKNDDPEHWCAATVPYGSAGLNDGSPGDVNEPCSNLDHDGDAYSADDGDCDDTDRKVSPDAIEIWYDGVDQDCDDLSDYDQDGDSADSDEYARGTDCDDEDATINPAAADTWYDGVDSDCDGASDYDRDADGYDYMLYGGDDCADQYSGINPGATEVCDGVKDEDCDGLVDDEDPSVTGTTTFYLDLDGDGYGTTAGTTTACEAPDGYASLSTDCDDTSAEISPVAAEIWYDGVDGDCDGASDYDADVDGFEAEAYGGEDCDDADADTYPGAPQLLGLGDPTCGAGSLLDVRSVVYGTDKLDRVGAAMGGVGDVDGDGLDDLLAGASTADPSGTAVGVAFIVLGTPASSQMLSEADMVYSGATKDDQAGAAVDMVGDWDGDGYDDVVVGAVGQDDGGSLAGAAYVVLSPASSLTLSSADLMLVGEAAADSAGIAVATAGDVDEDGVVDLLVGASGADTGGSASGVAYFISGGAVGTVDLSAADGTLVGEVSSDGAGANVASAGDVDGDGVGDVIVGAPARSSARGAAYVVLGPLSGTLDLGAADARFQGSTTSDNLGCDLDGLGDQDGDGYDDIVVGAYGEDLSASNAGAAFIFNGPHSGFSTATVADASLMGVTSSDAAGYTVAGTGDMDGDGSPDVAVGVFNSRVGGAAAAGAVAMVRGPFAGSISLEDADDARYGSTASESVGASLAGLGDLDGDGLPDLGVGAYGDATNGSSAGAVWLLGLAP